MVSEVPDAFMRWATAGVQSSEGVDSQAECNVCLGFPTASDCPCCAAKLTPSPAGPAVSESVVHVALGGVELNAWSKGVGQAALRG